ncbi:AI-2E family transporter [Radiobacillus kanasensis]|uniref:AI-2E family transporter n=1 Tax=Radiobacillus kanasensis TaxID=2844358 RepID=UPI001E5541D6|nr:AI-2E family transporter [Radiobacillus kanasensis]UFU01217.1 AI-2E family transporter [Radiobacillus kanasensis]
MVSKKRFQYLLIQILLILTIIFVSTKLSFLFQPIGIFITTLFFPILITTFLYLLLNPIVHFIEQKIKVPRILAIVIIYVLSIGLFALLIANFVPTITKQFTALANDLPSYARTAINYFDNFSQSDEFKEFINEQQDLINNAQQKLVDFANNLPEIITGSFRGILSVVTNLAIIIATVPLLLFYMFKDGHKFPNAVSKFIPEEYRKEGLTILKETSSTLSAYLQGQVTVGLFVGFISLIGYLIIDLPYAFVLAITVAFTNIIPYIGPLIGGAPAVIVALFDSPTKALFVLIILVVAQQIEGNFLSPLILGKSLDTHPATIIILLLAAGNLAGVLGMILAVPTYATVKTIVLNVMKFLKARKEAKRRVHSESST